MPGLNLQFVMESLATVFLASLRVGGFLIASPFFGGTSVPLQPRIIMAVLLGVAVVSNVTVPSWQSFDASKLCQLGTVTFDTTATPSKTAIIIRGCNGTDVPPKNGDAIKNPPTRRLAKNTVASDSMTNCRFRPGKVPTPPRFESAKASISRYA